MPRCDVEKFKQNRNIRYTLWFQALRFRLLENKKSAVNVKHVTCDVEKFKWLGPRKERLVMFDITLPPI